MADDFPLDIVSIKPEKRPDRNGDTHDEIVVKFWLGKFGPFPERFDAATYNDVVFNERVEKIRRTLVNMHR